MPGNGIALNFPGGWSVYVTSEWEPHGKPSIDSVGKNQTPWWGAVLLLGARTLTAIMWACTSSPVILNSGWNGRSKSGGLETNGVPLTVVFLCSDHFEADCFEVDSVLAEQMGLKKRKKLKPDAVPAIFVRHVAPEQGGPGPSSSGDPVTFARKRAPASSSTVGTDFPPRKRMAFEKRERLRVSELVDF